MIVEIHKLDDFVNLTMSIGNEAGKSLNQYQTIIDLHRRLDYIQTNIVSKITEFNEINRIDETINEQLNSINKIVLKIQNKSNNLKNIDFGSNLFIDTRELLKSLLDSFQTLDKLITELYNKTMQSLANYDEMSVSIRVSRDGETGVRNELAKLASELIIQTKSILSYSTGLLELAEDTLVSISDAAKIFNENSIKENILKINFTERLNEEKALLIKQFNNELTIIQERYETAFKSYESDRDRIQQSANLLGTTVDAGLKTANELNEKTQKLESFFSTMINEKKSEIEEELEREKNKISTIINDAKDALFEEEKTIRDAHKDFLTIVQATGIHKLTENYKKKSEDERGDYRLFRNSTTLSILAAIGCTYYFFTLVFKDIPTNQAEYLILISRLSIPLMFFVLAYYLSKQAAKHYECYQENHRTYLQLAALEPFMARMNEEEKKDIRKTLIPTYFNQNSDGKFAPRGEEVTLPIDIKAYAEKLIDVGKNLLDKSSDQTKPNGN